MKHNKRNKEKWQMRYKQDENIIIDIIPSLLYRDIIGKRA